MFAFHNYVSKPLKTFFCLLSNKDPLSFIELYILKMLYCNFNFNNILVNAI